MTAIVIVTLRRSVHWLHNQSPFFFSFSGVSMYVIYATEDQCRH